MGIKIYENLVGIYIVHVCPLAIVATLYAFLVRNVDSNFSESKWISYAMYSVCVSWMIDGVILVFTVSERASSLRSNVDPDPEVSTGLG